MRNAVLTEKDNNQTVRGNYTLSLRTIMIICSQEKSIYCLLQHHEKLTNEGLQILTSGLKMRSSTVKPGIYRTQGFKSCRQTFRCNPRNMRGC